MEAPSGREAGGPGSGALRVVDPPPEDERRRRAAEALAALLLLAGKNSASLRQRASLVVRGARAEGLSLAGASRRLASATTSGLDEARSRAAAASRRAFEAQTGLGAPLPGKVVPGPFSTEQTGAGVAERWAKATQKDAARLGVDPMARSAAGVRRAASDLERAAVTETHQAYEAENRRLAQVARERGHRLVRAWNATLDRRTCPGCAGLDGLEVGEDEEFPDGDPPLHARCRCVVEYRRA